jgi:hypothetical protein
VRHRRRRLQLLFADRLQDELPLLAFCHEIDDRGERPGDDRLDYGFALRRLRRNRVQLDVAADFEILALLVETEIRRCAPLGDLAA